MKPVIIVIGYNEEMVSDNKFNFVSYFVGTFDTGDEANTAFMEAGKKYEFVEVKTVYQKSK